MLASLLAAVALVFIEPAPAQQAKPYRVGVIHEGGPFNNVVDGLKDGLKDLGLEAGKDLILEVRDAKGDPAAVEEAARSLERDKVNLIFVISTSVTTKVKRATTEVPIVFAVGADPVAAGLVESFAKPGGRLTGVHFISAELTAKRLELLKEILPRLRKVITFYDPGNAIALAAAKTAREAARQLKIEIIERPVTSAEELRLGLKVLEAKDADAYFYTNDAMVTSQVQSIIDVARAKNLPTMFHEESLVAHGALVSYGVGYYQVGRLSAKYVQRVLTGTSPGNLPVESISRLVLAVNLKTARELGITIPQSVVLRADKVIE
jgi:ABC-type uncharacterized transport system substrate-binding protein